MNVNTVFTPREPARPEPSRRPDVVSRTDSPNRSDTTDRVEEHEDDSHARPKRPAARAEFAALMAVLAGAGTKVRADLLRQAPAEGVALLDKLLDGSALDGSAFDADATGDSGLTPDTMAGSLASSQRAADALRYGILKDSGSEHDAANLDALSAVLAAASGTQRQAHLNEVIGRIVARSGASVDQLKARGDNEAADVRAALDALLAKAGTPIGLELASAPDNAALAAAASALANAKSVSATDVTAPVRDTDALAPELRQKLTRVIDRMKNEYGHSVDVVETARSQERQDFLYEQGRTRPGAVVTWTRDSAHTRGEAVDVTVDGKWNNADGFARLQRIAREEGLRTLGIRDPGHLELAGGDGASDIKTATRMDQKATPLIATAATQSGVARVAGMAGVAGVARVADNSGSRGLDRTYSSRTDFTAANTNGVAVAAVATNGPASEHGQGNAFGRGERDAQNRPLNDGRKLGDSRREALDAMEPAAFGALNPHSTGNTPRAVNGDAPAAAIDSASRVADLQQLRDSVPAGSVSRMTLNIDAPDGGQDRITVDLRGTSVGTQINTDAGSAEQLRLRTAELQDALGRHGLESDSVRISSAGRLEANDAARMVGGERDGVRLTAAQQGAANDSTANQGQRERAATAREWDRPESSRQSREEERESARQGAGQRGQRGTPNGSAS